MGKPREFWILERRFNPVSSLDVYSSKEILDDVIGSREKLFGPSDVKQDEYHVIEVSALTTLESELARHKEALAAARNYVGSSLEQAYDKEIESILTGKKS